MALLAAPASASQGLVDFFGGTGSSAGKFATGTEIPPIGTEPEFYQPGPSGIAVNDTTGDIYVADRANNRIQQFDSDKNLIRAWGFDTIPSGAGGTGNLISGSKEVTTVVTSSKAFIPGQEISGAGIPAGTTIVEVATGVGASSKLVLSQKATATGSGVALTAAGSPSNVPQNEKQTVAIKATAGTYKLKFATTMPTAELTTGPTIAFNATAATVQSALEGLANVGAGNVEVTGAAGGPYTVEFKGKFADTNVAALTSASNTLTNGPGNPVGTVFITTEQEGAGRFEKCTIATTCQAAAPTGLAGGMNKPGGVAVNQSNQNVYVADVGNNRVLQFDASGSLVRAFGNGVVESGPNNKPEIQSLKIAADSGTFILTFGSGSNSTTTATGTGTYASGSNEITSVTTTTGVFIAGKRISGAGIPVGTKITTVEPGKLILSANTTEAQAGTALTADLPYDASAATVEAALNALNTIGGAFGSVAVSGGPGNATGSNPFQFTFGGAFRSTNPGQIALDGKNLGVATGTVLSCTGGPTTGTPAPALSYQWLRNGVAIGGATSSTYTTVASDAGKAIQCRVKAATASDGATVKANVLPVVVSPAPAVVFPTPPGNIAAPSGTAPIVVGSTLTCAPGTWTPSTGLNAPTFTFKWLRNGEEIPGATSNTYNVQAADNEAAIQCEVTGTNAGGAVVGHSALRVIRSEPPGNTGLPATAPTISGTAGVGNTLTCANGTWTGSGLTFTYQWLRNGVEIGSATTTSYGVVAADAGAAIQCRVTATNAINAAGAAVSGNTLIPPVSSPPPPARPTSAISVGGTRNVGQVLTCTSGSWTPATPPQTYTFRWLRNGVEIPGSSSPGGTGSSATGTYTQVAADLDKQVQCQVTATSAIGASVAISASNANNTTIIGPPTATSTFASSSVATTTVEGQGYEICDPGVDICQSGVSASTGGAFADTKDANQIAVAPGGPYAGKLFVTDSQNNRIQIFDGNTGAFVGAFGKRVLGSGTDTAEGRLCLAGLGNVCRSGESPTGFNTYGFFGPNRMAIAPTGAVFVVGRNFRYLQKYSPDLTTELDFAPDTCTPAASDVQTDETRARGCSAVGVDPETGDVYVARGIRGERELCTIFGCQLEAYPKESVISRLDATGENAPTETMFEGFGVQWVNGFAFDNSTGEDRSSRIYVTVNRPEQRVDVIDEATPPTFTFSPIDPENVKAHEVSVEATINPNGDQVDTTYAFETLIEGGAWQRYPVPAGNVGHGTTPESVSVTIPSLRANTDYRIRLAVTKTIRELSPEQTFTTPGSAPDAETREARWSGPPSSNPSLTFYGIVDNNNLSAHYYFQYGPDTSYGSRVPLVEVGTQPAAQQAILVRQTVNGLDPTGTYHYRVVAVTAGGTSVGADREVGPAQSGGRFPEMVTPAEKGVGNVRESSFSLFFNQRSTQAAANGDRMAYVFEYGNPESTVGGELLELAGRGSTGWETEQLISPSTTPPLRYQNPHGFLSQGEVKWLSPELDCSFMQSRGEVNSETPAADVETGIWHLYLRDTAGTYRMVTPTPSNPSTPNTMIKVRGATPNCDRAIFSTQYKLLPGMPVEEAPHIYEWEAAGGPGGTLRLVDVLPDGSVPPAGSITGAQGAGTGTQGGYVELNAVSQPNADRAFFVATSTAGSDIGTKAIFVRKNHAVTVDVSQSQTAVPNTGTTTLQMASPDGSHVFFTAIAGLASNSTTTTGNSLYDYNVGTGVLRDLTPNTNPSNSEGAKVEGVLGGGGAGNDTYIYFATKGQLIAGKGKNYAENTAFNNGFYNVYVSHDGTLSYVGMLSQKDTGSNNIGLALGAFLTEDGGSAVYRLKPRTTPDGSYLVFVSRVNLTSYDSAGKREIYRYSADDDEVVCVSCRPDGAPPSVDNEGIRVNEGQGSDTYFPRAITPDGSQVFFTSSEELAEGGTGKNNAFEWHNGTINLLTREGTVLDISTDASSVFVRTPEPLAAQDRDKAADVYNLRVNGGFAYFPPEPCDPLTENSCQGTPPTPPAAGVDPASGNFNGPGNPPASKQKQCKKGQALRKGKCVKKPQKGKKTAKRAAGHNRGGSK